MEINEFNDDFDKKCNNSDKLVQKIEHKECKKYEILRTMKDLEEEIFNDT